MALADDSQIELGANVLFSAIDENEGCLLDSDGQAFYTVNGVGLVILEGIRRGLTFGELVAELTRVFEVPTARCEQDAEAFIAGLLERRLVTVKT
jgi:hypothetical protein